MDSTPRMQTNLQGTAAPKNPPKAHRIPCDANRVGEVQRNTVTDDKHLKIVGSTENDSANGKQRRGIMITTAQNDCIHIVCTTYYPTYPARAVLVQEIAIPLLP